MWGCVGGSSVRSKAAQSGAWGFPKDVHWGWKELWEGSTKGSAALGEPIGAGRSWVLSGVTFCQMVAVMSGSGVWGCVGTWGCSACIVLAMKCFVL